MADDISFIIRQNFGDSKFFWAYRNAGIVMPGAFTGNVRVNEVNAEIQQVFKNFARLVEMQNRDGTQLRIMADGINKTLSYNQVVNDLRLQRNNDNVPWYVVYNTICDRVGVIEQRLTYCMDSNTAFAFNQFMGALGDWVFAVNCDSPNKNKYMYGVSRRLHYIASVLQDTLDGHVRKSCELPQIKSGFCDFYKIAHTSAPSDIVLLWCLENVANDPELYFLQHKYNLIQRQDDYFQTYRLFNTDEITEIYKRFLSAVFQYKIYNRRGINEKIIQDVADTVHKFSQSKNYARRGLNSRCRRK